MWLLPSLVKGSRFQSLQRSRKHLGFDESSKAVPGRARSAKKFTRALPSNQQGTQERQTKELRR
jgi:hypothetical protein